MLLAEICAAAASPMFAAASDVPQIAVKDEQPTGEARNAA